MAENSSPDIKNEPNTADLLDQEDKDAESVVMDEHLTVECEVAINLEEDDSQESMDLAESNSVEYGAVENVETSSVKEEDGAQYRCFQCGFESQEWPIIEEHYKTHTSPSPFKSCDIGYECTNAPVTKTEDPDQEKTPFTCVVCRFTSDDEYLLKEHIISTHSDIAPFLCAECNKVFNIKRSFSNHLLLHTGDKPHKCPYCTFCCKLTKYLKNHINTMHSGKRRFSCSKCAFTSKRKADLTKHVATHETRKRYRCDICPFVSKSQDYLNKHKQIHKGILPFHCNTCDFQCVSKLLLQTHYINHHTNEKPFACEICGLRFKHNSTLQRHMHTHSDAKPFMCPICDFACSRRDNLRSHVNIAHNDKKPFKCDQCSFRGKVKAVLNFHKKVHDPERPFECHRCGYRFMTEPMLRKHAVSHSFERFLSCTKCLFKSKTRTELDSHINYCHGTNYPFGCYLCPFVCKKQSTFIAHLKKHNTGRPNQCKICNQRFEQPNDLQRHLVSHARHIYSCNLCSFYTNLKQKFSDHMQRHCQNKNQADEIVSGASCVSIHIDSTAENPVVKSEKSESEEDESDCVGIKIFNVVNDEVEAVYVKDGIKENEHSSLYEQVIKSQSKTYGYQCEHCDMTFTTTGELKLHSKKHIPVKTYICPACNENYSSRTDLKDHMTINHIDFKPYKCEICNLNFRLKTNLAQHSVIHSDNKPYKCSLCDYRAKLRETLKRHYVTHSTEKPFKCSICSYSCKLKEKLKRHNLIHSNDKPFTCSQCNYSCKSKELLKRHVVVHSREEKKSAKSIKKEIKKRKK